MSRLAYFDARRERLNASRHVTVLDTAIPLTSDRHNALCNLNFRYFHSWGSRPRAAAIEFPRQTLKKTSCPACLMLIRALGWSLECLATGRQAFHTIETEVWKPNPDQSGSHKGTIVVDYRYEVEDVLTELNLRLCALHDTDQDGVFDESNFSNMAAYEEDLRVWPDARRIIVFPVTGGSEGHYVHVAAIIRNPDYQRHQEIITLGLCKTFRGWEHACLIANEAARLLGC